MSDGELDEGNSWEAIMFAGNQKLHNLTAIIDRNNIQIDGRTEDVLPLESLRAKMESFNFHVIDVDGHDFRDIVHAIGLAKSSIDKPTVLIAHTIPGKGVTAFEGDYKWHGKSPSEVEGKAALQELRTMRGKVSYGEL